MVSAHSIRRGRIRVWYPLEEGKIVLRTSEDWDADVEAVGVEPGRYQDFEVSAGAPFLHYKACLVRGDQLFWETGPNQLALLGHDDFHHDYPTFVDEPPGIITDVIQFDSAILERSHRIRVYLPPGYGENHLKHYPVLYMQDGANMFFPDEAFLGRAWKLDQTVELLLRMSLIEPTLVVGIYAGEDRNAEYTHPGYERYGRAVVDEIRPVIAERFRVKTEREHTIAMGSSLGGVAAFYMAWTWPEVFGHVACLSSTFSYRDDLIERVRREPAGPRRGLRFYLDSGWPHDNYEATVAMAAALGAAGFELGRDVVHLAFPLSTHDEGSWAARCHLPLQLFSGRLRKAADRWSKGRASVSES